MTKNSCRAELTFRVFSSWRYFHDCDGNVWTFFDFLIWNPDNKFLVRLSSNNLADEKKLKIPTPNNLFISILGCHGDDTLLYESNSIVWGWRINSIWCDPKNLSMLSNMINLCIVFHKCARNCECEIVPSSIDQT